MGNGTTVSQSISGEANVNNYNLQIDSLKSRKFELYCTIFTHN